MGSATRLESGVELRNGVVAAGGDDKDIDLVLQERPDLFVEFGKQLVETARVIRGDKDCFRLTDDEVVIEMPALKRPTFAEVKKDWSHISSIESDTSTEQPVTLRLSTVLKSTESSIDGATYERRMKKLRTDGRLLGWQHCKWLLENQDKIADPKARVAIKALLENVYIDFSGIGVVNEVGDRNVPYVINDGERWYGGWHWLGDYFLQNGRMAVSSK
jgi:hypothetical protein